MSSVAALAFLWWLSQRGSSSSSSTPKQPAWPTAASPPPQAPQMPAFQAQPPPVPDANTGTPLSALHQSPEVPPAASANEPAKAAAKAKAKAAKKKAAPPSAASRAARAARTRVPAALRKAAPKAATSVQLGPAKVAPTRDASVADLQAILNKRGAKLKKDGLYGPKTAGAWSAAARGEGLPTTITRVGPKVARVVAKTYEALAS